MIIRHISSLISQSLGFFPAVILIGARQEGKSTLAQSFVDKGILKRYITLDDLFLLQQAKSDPEGFILTHGQEPCVIDEVQRAPELLIAIKKQVDENKNVGQFLLTGSANLLSYPNVTESLAGRAHILTLDGISLGEQLENKKESSFLTDIFFKPYHELLSLWKNTSFTPFTKEQIANTIFYGGFPKIVVKQSPLFTEQWFSSYLKAYVERDVRDLSNLLNVVSFSKLFQLVAGKTASLLNINNLAIESGLDQRTVNRYLEILSLTFQANLLPPWHKNITKRLVKTSKIYLNDSGFTSYLLGLNNPNELMKHPYCGQIVETWAWSELRKLLVFNPRIQASFYRTHGGEEVDFILEKGAQTVGIECKFSSRIVPDDFKGLKGFQKATHEENLGIVLYSGNEVIPFAKNLVAIPFSLAFGGVQD